METLKKSPTRFSGATSGFFRAHVSAANMEKNVAVHEGQLKIKAASLTGFYAVPPDDSGSVRFAVG